MGAIGALPCAGARAGLKPLRQGGKSSDWQELRGCGEKGGESSIFGGARAQHMHARYRSGTETATKAACVRLRADSVTGALYTGRGFKLNSIYMLFQQMIRSSFYGL